MSNKKVIFGVFLFIASAMVAFFVLTFKFTALESLRFVLGSVFALFLPGFVWGFLLLRGRFNADTNADRTPKNGSIRLADRIILSFGLSFVMSPLIVFLSSKLGVKITLLSSAIEISLLIMIGLIILFVKEFIVSQSIYSLRNGFNKNFFSSAIIASKKVNFWQFVKNNLGAIILVLLIILLAFHFYYGIFHHNYIVPPGDDPTRHMTEAKGIIEQGFTKAWEGSLDPPLFHTLLALETFFTGQDVVTTTIFFVPFIFIISYLAFYFLVRKLFKNELIAIISLVLLVFISRQPGNSYSTGTYLNLFAGLCLFLFGLAFLKDLFLSKEINYKKIILCFLFFGGVFLTHSLSSTYMILTLFLIAFLLLILKFLSRFDSFKKHLKIFENIYFKNFLILIFSLFVLILPLTYEYYSQIFLNSIIAQFQSAMSVNNQINDVSVTSEIPELAVSWKAYDNHLGVFIFSLGLISIPFFFFKSLQKAEKIIIISWAIALFIGTRFSFFILPNRFALDLALPLIVMIAYFFLTIGLFLRNKSYLALKIVLILILSFSTLNFIKDSTEYNQKVRLQDSDAKALSWIRNNTDQNAIILSYPKTLAMRSWGSYINLLTGRAVIDGSDCNDYKGECPWIFDPNSELSRSFYKKNNIEFVYAGKKVLGSFSTKADIDWKYQEKLLNTDFLEKKAEFFDSDKLGSIIIFKINKDNL
ncbi:MAG: DUF6541 family protein [Patescibacteria group bacterium]|jgi:hypothetical protein